jgi:hypothetical protein
MNVNKVRNNHKNTSVHIMLQYSIEYRYGWSWLTAKCQFLTAPAVISSYVLTYQYNCTWTHRGPIESIELFIHVTRPIGELIYPLKYIQYYNCIIFTFDILFMSFPRPVHVHGVVDPTEDQSGGEAITHPEDPESSWLPEVLVLHGRATRGPSQSIHQNGWQVGRGRVGETW